MKHEPGFDQRHIERAAVVGARARHATSAHSCDWPSTARSCSKPGSRNWRTRMTSPSSDGAADQKRLRAGAAEEPGGLEIEKQQASVDALRRRPGRAISCKRVAAPS